MTVKADRDLRIDVMRGVALLMIFVDHIPRDLLGFVTLHDFGFCDAAEVFVLLAGVSSMLAYGRAIERDGMPAGLSRIGLRCARIYVYQIALLIITLAVVYLWDMQRHEQSALLGPIFTAPASGLVYGLTLRALPSYLDILPLYIVLLAVFPAIYAVLRRSIWLALGLSCLVWIAANTNSATLDFPNWIDGKGWYFNPFAWQFLFTIGAALSAWISARSDRLLPYWRPLAAVCGAYLLFTFLEAAPWKDWGLPDLRPFATEMPDKSTLAWPRIADILALVYLLFSSERIARAVRHRAFAAVAACGRHSLEVFSAGCVLALFGRLAFRAFDATWPMQVVVNAIGIASMLALGLALETAPPQARGTRSWKQTTVRDR